MMNGGRLIHILFAAALAVALWPFYVTYVPLVASFQAFLAPVLLAAVLITAASAELGALYFLLAFPLVNSLPYFFGIHENIPHAPTALILFLAYLLGWSVRRAIEGGVERTELGLRRQAGTGETLTGETRLSWLMALAAGLVAVSVVITVLRFYNFYPFIARGAYDLVANVNGVTAGGARTSAVFSALNYVCGFAWFTVTICLFRSIRFARKAAGTLSLGIAAAALFGLAQHFVDPALGNTLFWVRMGQINATFKDPNAFGAVLSMAVPFALGAAIEFRGRRRIFFCSCVAPAVLVFPFIGARSALPALAAAAFVLVVFSMSRLKSMKQRHAFWAVGGVFLVLAIAAGAGAFGRVRLLERVADNLKRLVSRGKLVNLSPERHFLWGEALAMTRDYPLAGVGTGAFIVELPNYYSRDQTRHTGGLEGFRRNDSAENYFLQVGAEMGLIGLAVFTAVLAAVALRAVRGIRETRGKEGGFLVLGASAGMAAYFVNILFHSYIGSFETVFMFWTLAAIVFGRTATCVLNYEHRAGHGKAPAAALAGILVVFGAVFLWDSTHSLSIPARTRAFGLKQDFGVYPPEKTADGREFRWTGKTAGLHVRPVGPEVRVSLLASHPNIAKSPVRVRVFFTADLFCHRLPLGEIVLRENAWQETAFSLPESGREEGILLFEVSRTWNPGRSSGVPDARDLGVAVGRIE
jgi:O-antigen ligase